MIKSISGILSPTSIPFAAYFLYGFYRGVVGTSLLQKLTQDRENYDELSTLSKSHRVVDRYSDPTNYSEAESAAQNPAQVQKPSVQFWIDDRLIELCGGDRSQAEWLLHQMIRKNPDRTME